MEFALLLSCFITACSAFFFPLVQKQSMMNVCIYSVDPSRYRPKCFLCPSSAYQNVLQTCVNAASIPANVSYTQANCIEQNCAISRGKRSVPDDAGESDNSLGIGKMNLSPESVVQLHQLGSPLKNTSLNYGVDRKLNVKDNVEIISEEETFAVDEAEWEVEVDENFAD